MSELCSDLQCVIQTNDHVVKEPISLVCGHYICKSCITDQTKINCKICSVETNKPEFNSDKESDVAKNRIKFYLSELFDDLERRATVAIKTFKS